jgi:hypothetical protein
MCQGVNVVAVPFARAVHQLELNAKALHLQVVNNYLAIGDGYGSFEGRGNQRSVTCPQFNAVALHHFHPVILFP